ncbi:MAG: rhamnogalacturonan acetylesterase [Ignavibacteriae bacterium]|nr:rhamnogalacturonan acetylesterase [Ignavibacteriota bacterium]
MKRAFFLIVTIVSVVGFIQQRDPVIFLIGDSTVANKPLIGNPERGWGQFLPAFFREGITIENHARNGRSTKSFLSEGRWDAVMHRLQPGDFVLIQFGHNDSKTEDTTRFAAPRTTYRTNLLRFINETRSKQGNPILITPVCRRRFDKDGKFYDVHGEYPDVVRELGREQNVPVIDLTKRSKELFERLGVDESAARFMRADSGFFSALPKGKKDDTHFMSLGASEIAGLVAEEIRSLGLPLTQHLVPTAEVKFEGVGRNVVLDNFYNNERRTDSTGKAVRYHYVWHDSTNSGFSTLGDIIAKTGATIDTLCQQPTAENLKRASIYIVVDPDTPKETEKPNVIDANAAAAISQWVNAGGVLVLFANDKGNSEFAGLNLLAEKFGIHFNEDSRNRVAGREYQTGTFDKFPPHPLFDDVRKIFIKELSTLRLQEPALPLFVDGADVIIASARVGKGFVFAVGDPWFYNEYMGTWRLPEGYDNRKAAENLFRWIMKSSVSH